MTVVVGTAGHIDHGKTSLLRALTGIDADRLPEEQRRGMTIDVGYAHLRLPDGDEMDFVDVPGHERLIGNMLVGAGEIDAALLVVAADDGPRAQTIEHLELLDAIGIDDGIAIVTKIDLVDTARRAAVTAEVADLVGLTTLAGVPVLAVSSASGEGVEALRGALVKLRDRVRARSRIGAGPSRLAVDRAFAVRGRGAVVTGTLRGAAVGRGDVLRAQPGSLAARVRDVQVHNRAAESAGAGRVALNLAGIEQHDLKRGLVLSKGPAVEPADRLLVTLRPAVRLGRPAAPDGPRLRNGLAVRVHLGTDQVDGTVDMGGRAAAALPDGSTTAILRLERPVAAAFGDRLVVRRPSPGATIAGGVVLDPLPPRGVSRRRVSGGALRRLAEAPAGSEAQLAALVALHGTLGAQRVAAWAAMTDGGPAAGRTAADIVDPEIRAALEAEAVDLVAGKGGLALGEVRAALAASLRKRATVARAAAVAIADDVVGDLVAAGRLAREGDRVRPPGEPAGRPPELAAAMDRLEAALAVAAPPSLTDAARTAGCSLEGVRALEVAGRIVRVEDDLAWAAPTLARLQGLAVRLAAGGPLSPAAFRDATGTSRRYALAILEDLDRRTVLRRTPAGHVPGPRAGSVPVST